MLCFTKKCWARSAEGRGGVIQGSRYRLAHLILTGDSFLCEDQVGFECDDVTAELLDVLLLQLQQPAEVQLTRDLDVGLQGSEAACGVHWCRGRPHFKLKFPGLMSGKTVCESLSFSY